MGRGHAAGSFAISVRLVEQMPKPVIATISGSSMDWMANSLRLRPTSGACRKSTVRKPSALSAELANDFENCPVHNPPDQKELEAHYEREGCFGKRAQVPHHRFVVSADCSVPS
jgi:hypothetical protein